MQITPHLWFDKEAKEAANFYVDVFKEAFPDTRIDHVSTIRSTPSGECDILSFTIAGQPFMAISAGPMFKINPSISMMINFDPSKLENAREHLQKIWNKLVEGGEVKMPLNKYDFSEFYGWVQDKYGFTWQLILTNPVGEPRPVVIPALMFTGDSTGKAEEATDLYIKVFPNSRRGTLARYPAAMGKELEGKIMFTDVYLDGSWLVAMDSGVAHKFTFNEAVSLLVPCKDQKELDYYADKLSSDPEKEQCGWIKDKYGVSWQIWPTEAGEMMEKGTPEQVDRVVQAFLPMKRFDLEVLRKAFKGN